MLMREEFYTPAEVARLLKVSKQTVWAWTRSGELHCLRFGRAVRVPRSDLEAFLNKANQRQGQGKDEKAARNAAWRSALNKADTVRARIRARVEGPLPNSVDDVQTLREERSRGR